MARPGHAINDADEERANPAFERWLSCTYKSGILGVAFYDKLTNKISAMQVADDKKGAFAFQMLQTIKLQTDPEVILISSMAEGAFQEACRQPILVAGEPEGTCTVKLERPSLFLHSKALSALGYLKTEGATGSNRSETEHLQQLATHVDLSQPLLVSALGALVASLVKQEALLELVVTELAELSLSGHLVVDPHTLSALGIFKEERHPSFMGIGTSKEGFSVFGLLQRCVTQMGKRLLRNWFLRPVANLATLGERHDTIEHLIKSPEITQELQKSLKKVQDVPQLLSKLRLLQAKPDAVCFRQLVDSLAALLLVRDQVGQLAPGALLWQSMPDLQNDTPGATAWAQWLSSNEGQANSSPWDHCAICRKILASINDDLLACRCLITDVIDQEQAAEGMMVQYGVCDQLDALKEAYRSLPDFLTQVVEQELKRIPPHIARRYADQLWSVVYIPQVGYVMQLTGEQLSPELQELLPDYELAFAGHGEQAGPTGDPDNNTFAAYYYTNCTQQLNQQFGDMLYKIQDLEASICTELIKRLLQFSPQLHKAAAAVAELDCLISLAVAARELNYTRPELTTEHVLEIQGGRHPLAELLTEGQFIPNNTLLPAEANRVHVITGPNASGKSCYIKQMTGILNKATSRSLVLIDEFGKGTLTSDGVGLLAATLESFAAQPNPPQILACTHFSELLQPSVLAPSPQIQFQTMAVMLSSDGADKAHGGTSQGGGAAAAGAVGGHVQGGQSGLEQHVFLYKLVPGHAAASFGVQCAHTCGVPDGIVQRASDVIKSQQDNVSVQRLQLPLLEERHAAHKNLVERLAMVDFKDQRSLWQLLQDAVAAEALA